MGKAFDITLVGEFLPKLLSYLHITLFILAASLLLGLLLGFTIVLPRLYKVPVLNRIIIVYVSFIRGTPILIQLFLVYYGLPEVLKWVRIDVTDVDAVVFVIITYSLHLAAYVCEIVRAAVNSVDRGQIEAAYATGMTGKDAFVRIILPQAMAIAFPNFGNLVISGMKDTSLAFSVGVMDMVGRAETLLTTNHFLEVYMSLAIVYYAICILLERMFVSGERRLLRHESSMNQAGGLHYSS